MYLEEMSSLHNGFLEVLTGLGLMGFLIAVYMLSLATWRAWGTWNSHPQFAGTYVLIIHVWMTTIMSTGLLGWMGYEVAIFLCIITNLDLVRASSGSWVRGITPVRWTAEISRPNSQTAA
jgi:O-antigen ligase